MNHVSSRLVRILNVTAAQHVHASILGTPRPFYLFLRSLADDQIKRTKRWAGASSHSSSSPYNKQTTCRRPTECPTWPSSRNTRFDNFFSFHHSLVTSRLSWSASTPFYSTPAVLLYADADTCSSINGVLLLCTLRPLLQKTSDLGKSSEKSYRYLQIWPFPGRPGLSQDTAAFPSLRE